MKKYPQFVIRFNCMNISYETRIWSDDKSDLAELLRFFAEQNPYGKYGPIKIEQIASLEPVP